MRYGIPLLEERVAPRCTCADCLLVVLCTRGAIATQERLPLDVSDPSVLLSMLHSLDIDTIVCGGVDRDTKEILTSDSVKVIDNVACSVKQLLAAIAAGHLRAGYGIECPTDDRQSEPSASVAGHQRIPATPDVPTDCRACLERICLNGDSCLPETWREVGALSASARHMLEATTDIAAEEERRLCRVSELIYFCHEMHFSRIGLAFCEELREPAEILAGVLDRSFETVSVSCRVGGPGVADSGGHGGALGLPPVKCNPVAQAAVLNRAGCDINVLLGLCLGSDCIFAQHSLAPVTTLFVKDRSLANNPISAVYSEYYLRESMKTARSPIQRAESENRCSETAGQATTLPKRKERS